MAPRLNRNKRRETRNSASMPSARLLKLGLVAILAGFLAAGCATVESLEGKSEREIRALEKAEKENAGKRAGNVLARALYVFFAKSDEKVDMREVLDPYSVVKARQKKKSISTGEKERVRKERIARLQREAAEKRRQAEEALRRARLERKKRLAALKRKRKEETRKRAEEARRRAELERQRQEQARERAAQEHLQASVQREKALYRAVGLKVPSGRTFAPDFSLPSVRGKDVKLSDYRGKVVLLTFWATWVPFARPDLSQKQRLQRRFRGAPFEVVTIVIDRKSVEATRRKVREFGFPFTVLLDPKGTTTRRYGIRALPTTLLIGPDGEVLASRIGAAGKTWDSSEMIELVKSLLRLASS